MSAGVGVLLMAHGTPTGAPEIEPFYTRIRRGRPPTAEQLAELEGRYRAIGGVSPLAERTAAQVAAVRAELEARRPGRYTVSFGAKHTDPLIEEAAGALAAGGVGSGHRPGADTARLVHGVRRSISTGRRTPSGPRPWWRSDPGTPSRRWCRCWRRGLRDALARQAAAPERTHVLFTAHSLPERIRAAGDTYPAQLEESAQLVARAAGLSAWGVAWQSAGRTPEPWLGPDVRDEVRRLAAEGTTDAVVVCPIGFVADHLEVLYDLDVELAAVAAELRVGLRAHGVAERRPGLRGRAGRRHHRGRRDALTWRGGWSSSAGASAGSTAAWELTGGAAGPDGGPEVVLLEQSGRLGGALRSEELGDRMVDVGPDGFLGRRPEAAQLAREVGLADALVPIAGRGASVWARGKLRPMPEALALGVPTRFWPTARSGILGLRGRLGLARDALLPRPGGRGPIGDRSVGPLVARKLGQRVVDALVDPLIGGIHAGSVDDMSTAAAFPALLVAAQRRGSLMRALRAEMPAPDPDGAARSSGRSTAAWPRWSVPWRTPCAGAAATSAPA